MFSEQMKDKIAKEMAKAMMEEDEECALYVMLRDGFEGVRSMKDQQLFRYAMRFGLLDEDAGQER